jgi:type I restriction enzyme R subunit
VVQELPYKYQYEGKQIFSFRPDLCFFVNGFFLLSPYFLSKVSYGFLLSVDDEINSSKSSSIISVNGIYLGFSELKSNYNNQNARKNGRGKVVKDYFEAVKSYFEHIESNSMLSEKDKEFYRRDFLKIIVFTFMFQEFINLGHNFIGAKFLLGARACN